MVRSTTLNLKQFNYRIHLFETQTNNQYIPGSHVYALSNQKYGRNIRYSFQRRDIVFYLV